MKQTGWGFIGLWAGLGAMAAGGVALLGNQISGQNWLGPIQWLGLGLRKVALSGRAGNLAAWAVTAILCALPLLLLLWRGRRGRRWNPEDWLLVLLTPQIFALIYFSVNPTLLGPWVEVVFPLAAMGCMLSTGVAWWAIKLADGMEHRPEGELIALFRPLMSAGAAVLAAAAGYEQVWQLVVRCKGVYEGNSADSSGLLFTVAVLAGLALLTLVPDLLGAIALLWGGRLAHSLGQDPFGQETVALCEGTATWCRTAAKTAVLVALTANVLQLLLLGWLKSTYFSVVLPLLTLMLSGGLYLLCRCLYRGRQLQDDSDSII